MTRQLGSQKELVNTVFKQPSSNGNSSHSPDYSRSRLGEISLRSDTVIRGTADIKDRIARALCARSRAVTLEKYGYNTSRLAICCSGKWNGKRLFAKVLLADPYPIPPRFRTPWELSTRSTMPVRTVMEQLDTEWDMTMRMLRLSGGHSVPVPLGRSLAARTIVWEEADGSSLIRALQWSRWRKVMAEGGSEALFKAGTWLRTVHEASHQGMEIIKARDLIETAIRLSREKQKNGGHYENMAAKILESSLVKMGDKSNFEVPVGLTHGDFCLANLLWSSTGKQLAVIDFELSGSRPIYYDLFALIADLRAMLLNPIVPKSVVQLWEKSFWQGYGAISIEILNFVNALALARIFYYHFSRLLTRRERKGLIGGINAQLYRTFLERTIISHRLDLAPELFHSSCN